jgi:hypothetical protein
MAITSLDKDTVNRLFTMLSLNDNDNISILKSNYSSFGQLKLIADQINDLQIKASNIIKAAQINDYLHKIEMNSKKVCGNLYYHYRIDDREILSLISPDEWSIYTNYLGKYLYNYDNLFYIVDN